MNRGRIEALVTGALTVAAIVVAASAARTAFFPSAATGPTISDRPEYISAWKDALPIGRRVDGRDSAPVTIVAVVDFQCPVCRAAHQVLHEILATRTDTRVVYVHYPLVYHRFAVPAAVGAECAAAQNRFVAWTDVVFDQQDSLNVSHWGHMAARAGVRDTAAFNACMLDPAVAKRVSTIGQAYGRTIKLTGTPTILVNGWKLAGLVQTAVLDSMITAIVQHGEPRT